jgi:tRNA U34 5-methylaminomethyl-2-thiouridine-forming methyltransferase MnmC
MWTRAMLEKAVQKLQAGGVFVTYCAKGQLKRDLKTLGLEVQSIPGPPGKREMVRAIKK